MSIVKCLIPGCLLLALLVNAELGLASKKGTRSLSRNQSGKKAEQSTSRTTFIKKTDPTQDYWNYLPFGAGQFRQQKTMIGASLAALQAGTLVFYFDRTKQIALANDDATAVFNDPDLRADPGAYDFFTRNESFVKKTQQEAQFALVSFLSFYALGIYDAIYDPLGLRTPKKKKIRPRPLEEELTWEPVDQSLESDPHHMSYYDTGAPKLGFGLIPQDTKLTYGLLVERQF